MLSPTGDIRPLRRNKSKSHAVYVCPHLQTIISTRLSSVSDCSSSGNGAMRSLFRWNTNRDKAPMFFAGCAVRATIQWIYTATDCRAHVWTADASARGLWSTSDEQWFGFSWAILTHSLAWLLLHCRAFDYDAMVFQPRKIKCRWWSIKFNFNNTHNMHT